MWNVQISSFVANTGGTTFNAEATGVRVEPSGNVGGPGVIFRSITNQAGAIVDQDGTADADLTPPRLTFNFRFVADNPAGHTQYQNLIALKGRYGTFNGKVFGGQWLLCLQRQSTTD